MGSKLRSRWPLLFLIILAFILGSYYLYMQCTNPSDRVTFRVVYGILGITSTLFLSLYLIRKKTYRYRFGSTQSWLQAHTYIGIISFVLIFMHSGFHLTGTFTIFLLILFLLVVISGIVGSLIYKTIPLSLAKHGRDVKPKHEVTNNIENYLREADSLVSNTSNEFREIYQKRIRPFFQSKRTKWEYLFMEEKELINKRRNMIESYRNMVPKQDIYDLSILSSILIEKEKLSFMWAKTKIQGAWLNFHLPLTTALLTAVMFHIWSILYY